MKKIIEATDEECFRDMNLEMFCESLKAAAKPNRYARMVSYEGEDYAVLYEDDSPCDPLSAIGNIREYNELVELLAIELQNSTSIEETI